MTSAVEALQQRIARSGQWPLAGEAAVWRDLAVWRAIREANGHELRPARWDRERPYVVDPLGQRIASVWADMLFGEAPELTAADAGDQDRLDALVEHNHLESQIKRAERICASEGEVWWRIVVDPNQPHAVIEWHSRLSVVPLWQGRYLQAAAFVSDLDRDTSSTRFRYCELHAPGVTRNLLFKGTDSSIGQRVGLESHQDTKGLRDEWAHGLDGMLCGRIVNEQGLDPRLGASDYQGVRDLLLALNEAVTIGLENVRLTAKRRVVVPQEYLTAAGDFPAGAEVIVSRSGEREYDPNAKPGGIAQVEWSFDAAALLAYQGGLEDTILTRVRVAPQLVGRHTEGAQTGPALRARLLDTTLAGQGKGREWDDGLPVVLSTAALAENLPRAQGGLSAGWSKPGERPTVKRTSPLPEDEVAQTTRTVAEVNAEILSRRTARQELHPDWDDDRLDEEDRRLAAEEGPAPPDPFQHPMTQEVTNGPGGPRSASIPERA